MIKWHKPKLEDGNWYLDAHNVTREHYEQFWQHEVFGRVRPFLNQTAQYLTGSLDNALVFRYGVGRVYSLLQEDVLEADEISHLIRRGEYHWHSHGIRLATMWEDALDAALMRPNPFPSASDYQPPGDWGDDADDGWRGDGAVA